MAIVIIIILAVWTRCRTSVCERNDRNGMLASWPGDCRNLIIEAGSEIK